MHKLVYRTAEYLQKPADRSENPVLTHPAIDQNVTIIKLPKKSMAVQHSLSLSMYESKAAYFHFGLSHEGLSRELSQSIVFGQNYPLYVRG